MCSQFTLHHKFRIDSGRTKFKQGKTDGILCGCESHEWAQRSAWAWSDQTTSCIVQAKMEKAPGYGVLVDFQLAQRKGLKLFQTPSKAIILDDALPPYCISKAIVIKSEEITYQKAYVSPRPPPKISYKDNLDEWIGFRGRWKQQRIPNESNQNPKTQLSSTGRPVGGRIHRERFLVWSLGHQALSKYGETRIGGSKRGARHWLQSTRTITCSCERSRTSPSSRACQKDRTSSSSRSTSCRLAAEQRLQPIQQKFEGDDPRIG